MSLLSFFLGKIEDRPSILKNATNNTSNNNEHTDKPLTTYYANPHEYPQRSLRHPPNIGKLYRGFKNNKENKFKNN